MPSQSRKLLVALAALLVLAFFIYRAGGMFHLGDFSGAKLLHAVRNARISFLLLSIVAIYGCYALRALRWRVFQRHVGKAQFWNIYQMTLAGFTAVFLLGRAGEPFRPLLLARKGKLPVADTFGIYVLERLIDAASAAVLAAIGLLLFEARPHLGTSADTLQTAAKTTGALLFAGLSVAIALLVYLRLHGSALLERRLQSCLAAHGWRARLAKIILGFVRGVQAIRTWGELVITVIYSAAHWFLVLVVYVLVTHSFGGALAQLTVSDVTLVLAFTLVGSAVQAPVVGGGTQVACLLAYTTIFGVEREPAAAAAIVAWLVSFAACSLAGVPILFHEGFSVGQLKQLAKHEKEVMDEAVAGGARLPAGPGEPAE